MNKKTIILFIVKIFLSIFFLFQAISDYEDVFSLYCFSSCNKIIKGSRGTLSGMHEFQSNIFNQTLYSIVTFAPMHITPPDFTHAAKCAF